MRKIIWTCWFQGRGRAPDLVQRCLTSWEIQNPDWDFRCLDATTIRHFVDIDQHIDLSTQTVTAASLSDIVRLLLLHEYGGVWVDATVCCNEPLDNWLPQAMHNGFFAFSKPANDRLLASWFLAAEPGSLLIDKWTARVADYWRDRPASDDYFWVHHQFDELCTLDEEARKAWCSTPQVSAEGPHTAQWAMHLPFEEARTRIDWTAPVFKLTHRVEPLLPGTLLDRILPSPQVSADIPAPAGTAIAQLAGLKVSTENLGDHIQIAAALKLLNRLGREPSLLIDRDNEIASAPTLADEKKTGILINGWFKTNPAEWPPHPNLVPIFLGFHVRLFQSPSLISPAAVNHYREFGPIGCRDHYTLGLMRSLGVDAFLSHCLSLTLERRLHDPENQTETFVVSRDQRIVEYLPASFGPYQFISQYSGSTDFASNLKQAKQLIKLYRSRAKLIVTTMLHCALPAIAMGIPVVVLYPPNEGAQHDSDRERFSTLERMIRVFYPNEISEVDWGGYVVDVGDIKLRLIDALTAMSARWGSVDIVPMGPIAPPEALPIPSSEKLHSFLLNERRLESLAGAGVADRQRWKNPASYMASWDDRAAQAATMIQSGTRVIEIGVGAGAFKREVAARCDYVGYDLEPLDSETRPINLDRDPIPGGSFHVAVALGVIEYLHRPAEAVTKLCGAADRVLISYCCAPSASSALVGRLRRGWVNAFSENDIRDLFGGRGFDLKERRLINAEEDFEQVLFLFQRTRP